MAGMGKLLGTAGYIYGEAESDKLRKQEEKLKEAEREQKAEARKARQEIIDRNKWEQREKIEEAYYMAEEAMRSITSLQSQLNLLKSEIAQLKSEQHMSWAEIRKDVANWAMPAPGVGGNGPLNYSPTDAQSGYTGQMETSPSVNLSGVFHGPNQDIHYNTHANLEPGGTFNVDEELRKLGL